MPCCFMASRALETEVVSKRGGEMSLAKGLSDVRAVLSVMRIASGLSFGPVASMAAMIEESSIGEP